MMPVMGAFLKGDGSGDFKSLPASITGLVLEGQVRDFSLIGINGKKLLLVAKNNEPLQFFDILNEK